VGLCILVSAGFLNLQRNSVVWATRTYRRAVIKYFEKPISFKPEVSERAMDDEKRCMGDASEVELEMMGRVPK